MLFIQEAHRSASIHVKITSRDGMSPFPFLARCIRPRHPFALSDIKALTSGTCDGIAATITTSGCWGAVITCWKLSWFSSKNVGRRLLRSQDERSSVSASLADEAGNWKMEVYVPGTASLMARRTGWELKEEGTWNRERKVCSEDVRMRGEPRSKCDACLTCFWSSH